MEPPYKGYTIVEESDGRLEITIPKPRSWINVIFLGYWLWGWVISEYYVLRALTGFGGGMTSFSHWLFYLVWFAGWTYGGFYAIQALVWDLVGKSIIAVGDGQLRLYRKGYLEPASGVYDLKDVKHFRVRELTPMDIDSPGMLAFEYGSQTVEFANELSERDAQAIVVRLKTVGILTDEDR